MSHPSATADIDGPAQLPAEYVYLGVAIIAAALAGLLWVGVVTLPITPKTSDILGDLGDILRFATGVAGGGYLIRSAEARVMRRIEHSYMDGYSDGFTDGAAVGTEGSPKRLRSIP